MTIATSTFDTGAEGWIVQDLDVASSLSFFLSAPAAFLGDSAT